MSWACRVKERDEKRTLNLFGKLDRKRSLGRHGRRWKDNIKINLRNKA
jgi:hypothetical protein